MHRNTSLPYSVTKDFHRDRHFMKATRNGSRSRRWLKRMMNRLSRRLSRQQLRFTEDSEVKRVSWWTWSW